jgi:hypothetical protein
MAVYSLDSPRTGGRCYDFKNTSAIQIGEKIGFFVQTSANFCKKFDHKIVFFLEKRQFFAENWQKTQKTVIVRSIT